MSLKTYDRNGQVWSIRTMMTTLLPSGVEMTFIVVRTAQRVRKRGLVVYDVIASTPDGKVWISTVADNLKSRWEQSEGMRRIA